MNHPSTGMGVERYGPVVALTYLEDFGNVLAQMLDGNACIFNEGERFGVPLHSQ